VRIARKSAAMSIAKNVHVARELNRLILFRLMNLEVHVIGVQRAKYPGALKVERDRTGKHTKKRMLSLF
jgi:hypothetical protein